jgi:hypothetical protein
MKKLITCLTVCVLSGATFATTWTVDDDGKADFDNIQAAVDAALDGDEIVVMPGTYTSAASEVIDMRGKEIWLHSSEGEEVTIIDGEGVRLCGILCDSGETAKTIIGGFTITNCFVRGMYNYNSSSPTLTDCTFKNNIYSLDGGGMYNEDYSSPTITNCTFTNNTAYFGGGMSSDRYSNPTLTNCTFTNNTAEGGGGISNFDYSTPTLIDCTFTDNTANYKGGGMLNGNEMGSSNPTVTNCTFTSNTAAHGGGMFNENSSSTTISDCIFENNTGSESGGGMYNWSGSSPTLTNCSFTGNTSPYGGGMCNSGSGNPTLTNCVFDGNTATGSGGGMYNLEYSDPTLIGCTIKNNTSGYETGCGIFNNNTCSSSLTDTTVCGNTHDQIWGYWTDNGGNVVADECPLDCPDINGDGYVDVDDLLWVIANFGKNGGSGDLNYDGIVDVSDILIVIGNWGECLPSACTGNGLVDNYTATVSSPCMGAPAYCDISFALSLNSSCSVTGTAEVCNTSLSITPTTWSYNDGAGTLTIGSYTGAVAEEALTFTTPLEQIFPNVAAQIEAAIDLLPPAEIQDIIDACGSVAAYVADLQMTWVR